MKKLKLLTALLIVFFLFGCNVFRSQTMADNGNEWVNPQPRCEVPEVVEDIFLETGESTLEGEAGILDFCQRMQQHFASSNMSSAEARKIYDMLLESGKLQDESFGMPSPDDPQAKITDFSTRAAIKKIAEEEYELFIVIRGGGFTYFHGSFKWPQQPLQLQLHPIEVWRASWPW